MSAALQVQACAPKPILGGRHLVELGMKPGPDFKRILEAAYDAQLEGKFSDLPQSRRWLAEQKDLPLSELARAALGRD
jgi:tRNA nucleotidyltransferase (CCA-adding enzyme)